MKGALPFVGMVVSHVAQVGSTLAAQKAISTGMHTFSFLFYSNAFASLLLLPAAFLVHRYSHFDHPSCSCSYISSYEAREIYNLCLFRRSPNRPALTSSVAGGFLVAGMIGYPKFTYTLLYFFLRFCS